MTILNYDPKKLKRELSPFYIGLNQDDQNKMLQTLNIKSLKELYQHLPEETLFDKNSLRDFEHFEYDNLVSHMLQVSKKNNRKLSFIGDGLKQFKVPDLIPFVCNLRGLTTAYTPYQPERSQGTLNSLWIYAETMTRLTGFEAVNASLYDRSTALFEAITTARKLKNKNMALVSKAIYPGDLEVLYTHAAHTPLSIIEIPIDEQTGQTDLNILKTLIKNHGDDICCIAFPHLTSVGAIDAIHELTDLGHAHELLTIAVIDPMLLATKHLSPPSVWGNNGKGEGAGTDMFVAEGQHLAIGPNGGGPGLGIFGIRYNEKHKNEIRQTAGRYIGKTVDKNGNECLCMVLSTREQHIRREKATSNICSNQSFIATLVGAGILARGEEGMTKACDTALKNAIQFAEGIQKLNGVKIIYPHFYHEVAVEIESHHLFDQLIKNGSNSSHAIQIGVDISARFEKNKKYALLVSFSDLHSEIEVAQLLAIFNQHFEAKSQSQSQSQSQFSYQLNENLKRKEATGLPNFTHQELCDFYTSLSEQNVSPDDFIYPLGSCTMKYNPYINDWAANLPGFTDIHPQAQANDQQGNLHILYEIQEIFKKITGLYDVTTQPVAGAQGELVGLKLFSAYFKSRNEDKIRRKIIIPKSAHGTNPATASVAGFMEIIPLSANEKGQINLLELEQILASEGENIAGIMVTNPNTSGIFETEFHVMSKMIHEIGGLVYMDGANMNAIAGWVNLEKLGVDAIHNNLHKTWSIPHGGGGPGDAIVAVSKKLAPFLPGFTVIKNHDGSYTAKKASQSIGSFHRHLGNFAHKVRAYTYLKALGIEGVRQMSATAVLSARYLFSKTQNHFQILPEGTDSNPRMHEYIISLSRDLFTHLEKNGTAKSQAMARIGKIFLDFGLHAPTVAFPEVYGLMIEPTESYTLSELDRFVKVLLAIKDLISESPAVLLTAPHFTPVRKVDEVLANKNLDLSHLKNSFTLPKIYKNTLSPTELNSMDLEMVKEKIKTAAALP